MYLETSFCFWITPDSRVHTWQESFVQDLWTILDGKMTWQLATGTLVKCMYLLQDGQLAAFLRFWNFLNDSCSRGFSLSPVSSLMDQSWTGFLTHQLRACSRLMDDGGILLHLKEYATGCLYLAAIGDDHRFVTD